MVTNTTHGLGLDQFSADEIVKIIGISAFKNDQLLESLLEMLDYVEVEDKSEVACLHAAPTAYEVAKRFYREKSHEISEAKEGLRFWTNPVAIKLLFNQLFREGIYREKPVKSVSYRDRFFVCELN